MRIIQVVWFASIQNVALSAAAIAKEYSAKLRLSPSSEKVTDEFVDTALTIGKCVCLLFLE